MAAVKIPTVEYNGASYFRQRLVMAVLSGKRCKIRNIRNNDDNPGLRDYEASFLRLLDKLTNGTVVDINITGTMITFRPGVIVCGRKINHDCGTQRSIGYFLEGIMPMVMFGKNPLYITFRGVTNSALDSSVDIIRTVTIPLLKKFGVEEGVELKILKRGAPPLGGGEVTFQCPSVRNVKSVRLLEQGKIKRIRGIAYSTRVSPQTSNRVVDSSRGLLNKLIPDVYIYSDHYSGEDAGKSPGYGLSLVTESTTGVQLSAETCKVAGKDIVPEDIGKIATKLLFDEVSRGGCVDTVHQPLCLMLMVLGPEDVSKVRLGKLSSFTVQYLRDIRDYFGTVFKIKPDSETKTTILTCVGMGYTNITKKIG